MSCLVAINLIHTRIPAKPSSPASLASSTKSAAILNLRGKHTYSFSTNEPHKNPKHVSETKTNNVSSGTSGRDVLTEWQAGHCEPNQDKLQLTSINYLNDATRRIRHITRS